MKNLKQFNEFKTIKESINNFDEQNFLELLMIQTNEELLDNYTQYYCYSPEDITPENIMNFMIEETRKEILSRMKK